VAIRDVTERTQAQRELAHARKQLQHSERLAAVGQLAGGVAHEINNPLQTLAIRAELLAGALEGHEAKAHVPPLMRAIDRCARIVRSLLSFARQDTPEIRTLQLSDICSQLDDLVGPQMHTHGVNLVLKVPSMITVRADPKQVMQVLLNLVLNGIDAHSPGELTITASLSGRQTVITVDDNGPGITPDHLERVFEPFFTTKPEGEGTGLGLSVSHGIANANKGSLTAVNRPEGGARFTLTLPST
jgi:two-component system NtrC family sensor kinase